MARLWFLCGRKPGIKNLDKLIEVLHVSFVNQIKTSGCPQDCPEEVFVILKGHHLLKTKVSLPEQSLDCQPVFPDRQLIHLENHRGDHVYINHENTEKVKQLGRNLHGAVVYQAVYQTERTGRIKKEETKEEKEAHVMLAPQPRTLIQNLLFILIRIQVVSASALDMWRILYFSKLR